jgi:hypothetical protein
MHAVLASEKLALHRINQNSLFWRTVDGALHTSAFVVLARLFDQNSDHNVDRVLSLAQDNLTLFAREALGERKKKDSDNAGDWLAAYLDGAYYPTVTDFRTARGLVSAKRKVFEEKYKPIRDTLLAHKELVDRKEIADLYSRTSIDEFAVLFTFLHRVYGVLWGLYNNGTKPDWNVKLYSAVEIVERGMTKAQAQALQERIVIEAGETLRSLAGLNSRDTASFEWI